MERWQEGEKPALSPRLVYEGDLALNIFAAIYTCTGAIEWQFYLPALINTACGLYAETQTHTVFRDRLNPLSLFLHLKGTAVLFHINEGNSTTLSCTCAALSHSISLSVFTSFSSLFSSVSFSLFFFFLMTNLSASV